MKIDTISELFLQTLRDALFAERRILAMFPEMEGKASDPRLRAALSFHGGESELHVSRLEEVLETLGKPPRGAKCDVVTGLIAHGTGLMGAIDDDATMDAALISLARAVEHYEIARYGALVAWSRLLGHPRAVALLSKTLTEEHSADRALSRLAERIPPPEPHPATQRGLPDGPAALRRSDHPARAPEF